MTDYKEETSEGSDPSDSDYCEENGHKDSPKQFAFQNMVHVPLPENVDSHFEATPEVGPGFITRVQPGHRISWLNELGNPFHSFDKVRADVSLMLKYGSDRKLDDITKYYRCCDDTLRHCKRNLTTELHRQPIGTHDETSG